MCLLLYEIMLDRVESIITFVSCYQIHVFLFVHVCEKNQPSWEIDVLSRITLNYTPGSDGAVEHGCESYRSWPRSERRESISIRQDHCETSGYRLLLNIASPFLCGYHGWGLTLSLLTLSLVTGA